LSGPPGISKKPGRDEWNIHVTGFANRFAVVHRLGNREFTSAFLNNAGNAKKVFASLASRHFGPGGVICHSRGFDCSINVRLGGFGDRRDGFLCRGRDAGERGAATIDELTPDE